jgi:phage N-6-adenine-methyltransferase
MSTAITQFDPEQFKQERPKREALIEYGKKLGQQTGDWSVVEEQVDAKLVNIQELLAWWEANVRGDGRPEKTVADRGPLLSIEEAQKATGATKQQVSRWRGALCDEDSRDRYRLKLLGPVYKKVFGIVHGTQGTGMDEWYTPEKYIESARKVLDGIELDPASSDIAQETVQAERYFTMNDNALAHEWKARSVFMNPPYSTEKVFDFISKLRDELLASNVGAAILLTNALTDTSWFHIAEEVAACICFTRGRIKFIKDGEEGASPTFGQAFFYFGDEPKKFKEHFLEYGFIR